MALAIDTIDGRGPSNETRRQLLPKQDLGDTVFAVHITLKGV